MSEMILATCKYSNSRSIWEKDGVVTLNHCRTVATSLIEDGTPDLAIMMRTGHCQAESLKYYETLRVLHGKEKIQLALGLSRNHLELESPINVEKMEKVETSMGYTAYKILLRQSIMHRVVRLILMYNHPKIKV